MARNALGRYDGNSRSGTAEPPISPRVASTRPLSPTIWIEGGRFGTSSDWIGGRCAVTHPIRPMAPMKHQRPTTSDQYAARPISDRRDPLLFFFLREPGADLREGSSKAGSCRSLLLRPA